MKILKFPLTKRERDLFLMKKQLRKERKTLSIVQKVRILLDKQATR